MPFWFSFLFVCVKPFIKGGFWDSDIFANLDRFKKRLFTKVVCHAAADLQDVCNFLNWVGSLFWNGLFVVVKFSNCHVYSFLLQLKGESAQSLSVALHISYTRWTYDFSTAISRLFLIVIFLNVHSRSFPAPKLCRVLAGCAMHGLRNGHAQRVIAYCPKRLYNSWNGVWDCQGAKGI